MLLDVADGFIQMGEDLSSRRNYLRSAISAWNISCLPVAKREVALKGYVGLYKTHNPNASSEELSGFEQDMRTLIKQKATLYPKVETRIANGIIESVDGKETLTVFSLSKRT